ncbi:hypothetical protein GF378_02235 [Candidatus Pacearchaeota archaeon]|nr:hypothetical protein [Candidatus Pacearchaeota archaeon]
MNMYKTNKFVQWILLVVVVLYIISGLGITRYQIIEPLTFGLLTKALAFKMHSWLLIPFLILIIMHIFPAIKRKSKKEKKK